MFIIHYTLIYKNQLVSHMVPLMCFIKMEPSFP